MSFAPGSLVSARGREWVVLPDSSDDFLVLRPLGGSDDDIAGVLPGIEQVTSASFSPPTADDLGDHRSARLLRSAIQIGFRSSTGPFRSLAGIAVEPRSYQLVPLLMAMRQDVVRLLIADDVGIGKTIEAGLIAAELLALGAARGLTVLCSPALAEQWREELRTKFGLEAELVLSSTVTRLSRELIGDESIFEHYPITVVSTDFIKSDRHRYEFLRTCPDLVIVDEAHTAVAAEGPGGRARQQRYELVRDLAKDVNRHLLLVTATPHSGKDETFRNLIGLLDEGLHGINLEASAERSRLASYFVQRRRADIRKYLDEETPFPKDRQTKEAAYALTAAYRDVFDDVLNYARETVRTPEGGLSRRVNWWSALALLRALASSPRAAAQTLRTRSATVGVDSVAEADAIGRAVVLDHADDEAIESADATPGADTVTDAPQTALQRRLRGFAKAVEALEGKDAKLDLATREVKQLLADGYEPLVFCRFIDTAEYVAEHFRKALRGVTVECVTGTLPPSERADRIAALGQVEGQRLLVATDCLSEGVNLQDLFQAVVHYDLAWNPTRHEQREGRVDRFGQRRDVVRAVTIYGKDNQIDGIVLDVLLRKHEAIRKATGVSVPVPDSSEAVVEALMEGLLLRGPTATQDMLELEWSGEKALKDKLDALDAEWQSAAERERQAVTKYAQHAIHPEEVAVEVKELREKLGTHGEVQAFVRDGLRALNSTITTTERGFTATAHGLPLGLLDTLPASHRDPLSFLGDHPAGRGEAVLHRTDDTVGAIASFILEAALDPALAEPFRPARRCAVIRTRAVTTRTTLLLVRYRFHLALPSREGTREAVAEDIATLAFEGAPTSANWLDADAVAALLSAAPDANVLGQAAHDQAQRILDALPAVAGFLDNHGQTLAEATVESHRRVRTAAGFVRRGLKVEAEQPADILGVYVYLPAGA